MEGKLRIAQTDGSEREIGDEKIRMVNGSRQAMPKKKKKIRLLLSHQESQTS